MISIIICSRKQNITYNLIENIEGTIGVPYELIIIDNSNNNYSIFQAYDKGVKLSKGEILCFMHEDILYHTQGWGEKVIKHFLDIRIGLIGVRGCHYYPSKACGWWYFPNLLSGQALQRFYKENGDYDLEHIKHFRLKTDKSSGVDAVAVDGFWFCARKELFNKIRFDNEYYGGGWHAYDIDICLQVLSIGFSVQVIYDILIEHFSNGNANDEWLDAMSLFQKKWSSVLPYFRGGNEETDKEFFLQLKWELGLAFNNRDISHYKETYFMISKFRPEYITFKRKIKFKIIDKKVLWLIYWYFKKVKKRIFQLEYAISLGNNSML